MHKKHDDMMFGAGLAALALALVLTLAGCAAQQGGLQGDQAVGRAHYNRAMAFSQNRQMERAAQELELAVKSDPGMYFSYYQLGLVYETMGRKESARLTWERGLRVAKGGPERDDYSRAQAIAEMESALARIEPQPEIPPSTITQAPAPSYQPPPSYKPKPKAKAKYGVSSKSKSKSKAVSSGHGYAVLVSSNQKKESAQGDVAKLKAKGYSAKVVTHKDKSGKTWYRVVTGGGGHDKAKALAAALKKKGLAAKPEVISQ